ncbi:MAG: hypothetical protein CW338_12095 [Clostridiales bacterium]|nr:hypothetical protein [Clostridiales bacterium]
MMKRVLSVLFSLMMLLNVCAFAEDTQQANVSGPLTADEDHLLLSFIGDCSIGDATTSRDASTSLTSTVRREGYAWPFSLVVDYLKADDFTFANLEAVLTERARSIADKTKRYNLIAPPDFTQVLIEGGVDAVNTVNNHCYDFTFNGYMDTLTNLDEAGIPHFGTVRPGKEDGSDILGVYEVKGVKIGIVGFCYPLEEDYIQKRIISRIKTLKDEGCQIVIVSLHWGRETHMTPSSWQYDYAKKLIDAGADVIWGHHAHVIQPIMFYKGKPVIFNTGNFTFGTMSEVDRSAGIFQLEYEIGKGGKPVLTMLRVVPLNTQGKPDYRPYELTDENARIKCLNNFVYKKTVKGYVQLPAEFKYSGVVYVNDDGTVYC